MKLASWLIVALMANFPAMAKMPSAQPTLGAAGLTIQDWVQVRAEYERHRHGMFPESGGYRARSFEQQWLEHFDGRGVSVVPDQGNWSWGLELDGVEGKAVVSTDVNRITYRWNDLDEWFVNDTRGLEHGFTLRSPRTIKLAVRGGLGVQETSDGAEFFDASGTVRVKYSNLSAWDANGSSVPVRLRVENGLLSFRIEDRHARYPITIDPIAQQAYVKASNTGVNDSFGSFGRMSLSGDTLVVGATGEASAATGINGDQSSNGQQSSGAVYVFVRNGVTWTQQAYLKASNSEAFDSFGTSVSLSGDTLAVGSSGESSNASGVNGNEANNSLLNSGATYVFVRSGTSWTQQAYLKASNPGLSDSFGNHVSVFGDTLAVSTSEEDSSATGVNGDQSNNDAIQSGAAYVFVRNGTTWTQQAYLKASNTESGDLFGTSVSLAGDTIAIGAPGEDSNGTGINPVQTSNAAGQSGAVFVFVRTGVTWTQQAYLKASNTEAQDNFGVSVAISGNTLAVGASGEDSNATGANGNQADNSAGDSGAVYVFVRNGNTWSQEAYLKASNTEAQDALGRMYVGLSGDALVFGMIQEDSNATGVNGDQANNLASASGSAYVFTRSSGIWLHQAYLKASNTNAFDLFGDSIAVSGDTLVIGAPGEASSSTGVNGSQLDNSASSSGAAYVFVGLPTVTSITIRSSPPGLFFSVSGAGCAPGASYVTPQSLVWTPGSSCSINFSTPQTGPASVQYAFHHWFDDASTNPVRAITAPSTSTSYIGIFAPVSGSQPIPDVNPLSGAEGRHTFSFLARHASNANSIQYEQVLFSKSGLSALNACYISYDPAGNIFYLLNDDMTQWYGLLGGSPNTIGNAQCTIHGATSGSSKVGTDLTTNLDISFRSGFSGPKTIFQFSGDTSAGTSGWRQMGTWNDTGDPNVVEAVSLTPNSGTGASQIFTAVVRDGDGANTISFVQLVMNKALSGVNGCFIHYDRSSNVFFLLNDNATEFSGMFAGSGSVSNSQCTLTGSGSGGTVNGNNLTITYNLTFTTFSGFKKLYMQPVDNTGVIEVWHQMGTRNLPGPLFIENAGFEHVVLPDGAGITGRPQFCAFNPAPYNTTPTCSGFGVGPGLSPGAGWVQSGDGDSTGTLNPTTGPDTGFDPLNPMFLSIPEGNNVAYSNGTPFFQVLSEPIVANTTYTLSFWAGERMDVGSAAQFYANQGYWAEIAAATGSGSYDARTVLARTSRIGDPGTPPSINAPNAPEPTNGNWLLVTLSFTVAANNPLIGQNLMIVFGSPAVQANFDDVSLRATPTVP